jgi:plastocyanin
MRFVPSDGCASYVGRQGGMQPIMLADNCSTGNTVHEIAHALGMFHEQSRCDRDTYVEILWANIQQGYEHNFDLICEGATDLYDYAEGSLMHYPAWAFSVNGEPTIRSLRGLDHLMGQRSDLGPTDVATIDALYQNQTPNASITSPAGNVTIQAGQSASFSGSAVDPDGTVASYSWNFPGGSPSASTAQIPGVVTYAVAGTFTATLNVTDNQGAPDPTPATRTITVQSTSTALAVSVTEAAFTPQTANGAQGRMVRWNFQGPGTHNATDRSGMGLFASGNKGAGTSYSFAFVGAGTYPYRCTLHPTVHSGTVKVPVLISPGSGRRTTSFTVTWASATAPSGHVYDVQIKRPGSTAFTNWKTAQTARSASFVPDAGTGTYTFRARLRKPAVAKASAYSAVKSINVSS